MKYFTYFPQIEYSNNLVTNLMVRTRIRDSVLKNTVVYYPYVVTDEDRADIIAHKYYGDPGRAWLIFYANEIVDPIFDWPLTYTELMRHLEYKYGSIPTAHQTIHNYYNISDQVIDYTTYLTLADNERYTKTKYEYEMEANEAKRAIQLIEDIYVPQILEELRSLFDDE